MARLLWAILSFASLFSAVAGIYCCLLLFLVPLNDVLLSVSSDQSKTASDLARDYVRNRQLLINLAQAIGQLILLSNKVVSLSGSTARVAELLEMVNKLKYVGNKYD